METPVSGTYASEDNSREENDVHLRLQKLSEQIALHESEKQQMREEFDLQRAKMKELYLQKEEEVKRGTSEYNRLMAELKRLQTELDEAHSQVTVARLDLEEEKKKYNDEVSSLQQLVTETVEVSSKYEVQLKNLMRQNERLVAEIAELRSGSTEPQLLSAPGAMISTLARKVVGAASQLGADSQTVCSTDNLEESMRKAQEDAKVLRSLVIPLEEEIDALKEKLRMTDEKLRITDQLLRKYQSDDGSHAESVDTASSLLESPTKDSVSNSDQEQAKFLKEGQHKIPLSPQQLIGDLKPDTSPEHKPVECDMCLNYEAQLVNEQKRVADLTKQLTMLERCREDLKTEVANRKEMEQRWNENKEEHKAQVLELETKADKTETALKVLRESFTSLRASVNKDVDRLREQLEKFKKQTDILQLENDKLIGRHNAHAQQLQDEVIDLPDKVEELQLKLLKCHEDLIAARVGQEKAEADAATQKEEALLYLGQREEEKERWQKVHQEHITKISNLSEVLDKERQKVLDQEQMIQDLQDQSKNMHSEMEDLKSQLENANHAKKKLEEDVVELRSRVTSLQTELDNGETVQQDFVRLTQLLQQDLERIRAADTQVRWEHEEDVEECPNCKNGFSVTRRKQHCRHCGRIFCAPCLSHTVYSGPNRRQSKVCHVCHTLLNKDTAPYFSTEPPHSSD